jgi:hypothetical protein
MPARSADTLFRGVLDYAGMFPPASLARGEAVATYTQYRTGADAWMVGAFVISADRLDGLDPGIGPVSVVLNAASAADVERLLRADGGTRIAAIEFRPVAPHQIGALAAAVPDAVEAYFEVSPAADMDRRLDAVAACGRSAKLRTGGVTPDAFPSASAVYRFLRACADRRVSAKATAGLHHALTGRYALTYEATSSSAPMHGFLNVCAAAALVHTGIREEDVLLALGESSHVAFRFDDAGMSWRGHCLSIRDLADTRRTLFRSFGTCSLREPMDDLKRMQAI